MERLIFFINWILALGFIFNIIDRMNKNLQCKIRRWDYPDELTFSILNDIIPSSATVSHHSYTGAKH